MKQALDHLGSRGSRQPSRLHAQGVRGEARDIGDPATQAENVLRARRDEIKRCLERSADRLLLTLAGLAIGFGPD